MLMVVKEERFLLDYTILRNLELNLKKIIINILAEDNSLVKKNQKKEI
jgi:hypothetical protein